MKTFRYAVQSLALLFLIVSVFLGCPARAMAEEAGRENRTLKDWLDQGALLSAYGNYDAAIEHYRKALELDPDSAEALFQLGVCYGELRRYDDAVAAMTMAIDRKPESGSYYYGRGRVHLISGNREKAMNDFMEAGVLGDPDARQFLVSESGVNWQ
ncbi:MAG: tetratricopeptide repeat protein [Desulfobacterales bacterium]